MKVQYIRNEQKTGNATDYAGHSRLGENNMRVLNCLSWTCNTPCRQVYSWRRLDRTDSNQSIRVFTEQVVSKVVRSRFIFIGRVQENLVTSVLTSGKRLQPYKEEGWNFRRCFEASAAVIAECWQNTAVASSMGRWRLDRIFDDEITSSRNLRRVHLRLRY